MAKKPNKPLLNEGTIRRMMKLADMNALGDGFISERFGQYSEDAPVNEEEEELDVETDIVADDGPDAEGGPDAEDDMDELEPEGDDGLEGEVVITDEEAQDIIDLADKLRDATGGEEEELDLGDEAPDDLGAEEPAGEEDLEEPGNRYMEEEELYEAALKGLNIEVEDDSKAKRDAAINEASRRIYKRVVNRLLKEPKK